MNCNRRRCCCLFAFLLVLLISPRPARASDRQPISPDDLALKDNPKQPGADHPPCFAARRLEPFSAGSREETPIPLSNIQ
jgi:hypothetical protein